MSQANSMKEYKRGLRAATQRRRRAKWIAAGLCGHCGKGVGPKCEVCLRKQRTQAVVRTAKRKAAGNCYRCNEPLEDFCSREVKYAQCLRCFCRSTSDHHLGTRDGGDELIALWHRQKGRCAYTKQRLVCGGNASLDHITPKTRGGADELENFQWVTKTVNDCKRNLTHEEWVALCKQVARC